MISIARFEDDFYLVYKKEPRKILIYGDGVGFAEKRDLLPPIDYLCDKKYEGVEDAKKGTSPRILSCIKEPIYIIISVKSNSLFTEICQEILEYDIDAIIFHLFNNIAFAYNLYKTAVSNYVTKNTANLRVNIVCQEPKWILRKFADRMLEELDSYDIDVTFSKDTREDVDINHHISFGAYRPYSNDTLMITHVNCDKLLTITKKQLNEAALGICMSKETMDTLVSYGIPRKKLCFINPAQDGVIKPHKYVIGITHRCYDYQDVRKRSSSILDMLEGVDASYFRFIIMGSGWDSIIETVRNMGFDVEYYPEFIYEVYTEIIPQMDYYLYDGFDEGSMGYLDAVAAGVGTIVTPQGFHLDNRYPIDYPCNTVAEFRNAFLDLEKKRKARIDSVREWNWTSYTRKHVDIWKYIMHRVPIDELYKDQLEYQDGIFSVYLEDDRK